MFPEIPVVQFMWYTGVVAADAAGAAMTAAVEAVTASAPMTGAFLIQARRFTSGPFIADWNCK
ncbi:hypothetical protein ACFQ7O_15220 [Streptomyces sp. NPDC056485]|uniref:hypothetical protein n=1 Tax=Streptomyces sp. NPDC056485 TaxID=3345834 RepID=UPI0036A97472